MRNIIIPVAILFLFGLFAAKSKVGRADNQEIQKKSGLSPLVLTHKTFDKNSWQYFLQNLPVLDSPVLDYKGEAVADQFKHVGIIPYDVGKRDLQQCADALMRLRAEYLFAQKRFDEIAFHFTGGQLYSFNDFCNGKKPVPKGNDIVFTYKGRSEKNHEALRNYLNIVYTYAGTISLAKELIPAKDFEVGTVVIYAGSPGHCFMIIDEVSTSTGEKLFKLAEGYTPAQSIYVLRNTSGEGRTPWHTLKPGPIHTASYSFTSYKLGKFE